MADKEKDKLTIVNAIIVLLLINICGKYIHNYVYLVFINYIFYRFIFPFIHYHNRKRRLHSVFLEKSFEHSD